MAKFEERTRARELRKNGESIKVIAKRVNVATATVSLWCRDIMLTPVQIRRLDQRRIEGGYAGRLKGAQMQKNKRLALMDQLKKTGKNDVKTLKSREFFFAGLGIYAGEGYKYGNEAGITNADPQIVQFMLQWFREVCGVTNDRFSCQVGINEFHHDRVKKVEQYWSKLIGIPLKQFWKTSLKKVKSKKVYDNPETHFGTLAIRVRKSAELEYRILGWLHALLTKL